MNKKLVAAVMTATMLLCTAGVAMASASDIDLSGDLRTHYRWQTYDWKNDQEGGKVWFRLNAKAALSDNVDAYARLAIQKLTGDHIGADFDGGYYNEDAATSIDRLGLVFKSNGFNYNVGRQGVTLGAIALMYSTEGYMGINTGAIDGLVVTGKSGATNLKLVAGQQWASGSDEPKIYAIDASYSPAKDWTVGAVYGKYDDGAKSNHWATSVSKNVGKASLAVEFGKSDANVDDTAYVGGVAYAFDAKNSAYAYYTKVEAKADMGAGNTDWDNNAKGFYVGYDHKLNKETTVSFMYKNMEKLNAVAADGIAAGDKFDSLRATVTYKF